MNSTLQTIFTETRNYTRLLLAFMCIALCSPALKADFIDISASTNDSYLAMGTSTVVVKVIFESGNSERADLIEFVLPAGLTGVTITHGSPSPSPYSACGGNTGMMMTNAGPGWGTPGFAVGNSGCGAFNASVIHTFGLTVVSDGTYAGDLSLDVHLVGDGQGAPAGSQLLATVIVQQVTCAILCPDAIVVPSTSACQANVSVPAPVTSGTCTGQLADYSGSYPVGDTEVIYNLTDDNGIPVACTTIVTVQDAILPKITCPNDSTITLAAGDCGYVFNPNLQLIDDCMDIMTSISQTNDDSTVDQGYACPGGPTSYWRTYDTDDYGINIGFDISNIDFRVFQSTNNPEITVNITKFVGFQRVLLGTGSANIGNLNDAMASIPVNAHIEPNTIFQVEVVVPGSLFYGPIMGFNDQGETNPTAVSSGYCDVGIHPGGVPLPVNISDLGFNGFGAVIIVEGLNAGLTYSQVDATGFAPGDTLPPGTYNFEFKAVDAAGNMSATCSFTYEVLDFPNPLGAIACNEEVQISLDEDCMVIVTPDMILEGGPYGCLDDFTVEIRDEDNVNYGNKLSEENLGQELSVKVTNAAGNSCWGKIVIQDKASAPLECIDVYTTCRGDLTPGSDVPHVVTYRAKLNPITSALSPSGTTSRNITIPVFGLNGATLNNVAVRFDISHEAISDLTASITSPSGMTKVLFMQPGTNCTEDNIKIMINPLASATAADLAATCVVGEDYAATGSYKPSSSLSTYNNMDPNGDWVITISDIANGNGGTINNVELVLSQSGAKISFPTTKDITYTPIDDYNFKVDGLDGCGSITLGYTDDVRPNDCASEFDKVIWRSWVSVDESGNTSDVCVQEIYVFRSGLEAIIFPPNYDGLPGNKPTLSCHLYGDMVPGTDVTGGVTGELCDIVQVFTPEDTRLEICKGSYKILRKFKVLQWCSGEVVEHTQVIKVLDKEGPEINPIPDMTISAEEFTCTADYLVPKPEITKDCSDEFIYTLAYLHAYTSGDAPEDEIYYNENVAADGMTITDLTFGNTWIKWIIEDECGNKTYDYFTLTVNDQIAPIAVCDVHTIVSVGGDGTIRVNAISFDDGSHDNCGIKTYKVRKVESDICGILSNTVFDDEVEFCCLEIGKGPIMVAFQVTDNYGNANTCMVSVDVQDKLPPYITKCPADITLDCQADHEDLSVTGEPEAIDNCEVASISHNDSGDIDHCGEGVITRTWTVTDIHGWKNSCIQTIVLHNDDPFEEDDIDWPDHYEPTTCTDDLLPENLPDANAYPRYNEGICSLVASTYKDKTFTLVDSACVKILRTWTVIDWCLYDEQLPTEYREGIYHYIQVIKLKNTEAPTIENCDDITIDTYGDCEGDVDFTLIAEDDCTPTEDLVYKYEIDLYNDGIPNTGYFGNSERINRILPDGVHKVKWTVEDKCGNRTICIHLLTARDGKKPTPYCRGSVVTAVMNNNGMVEMWASDFDLGSFDNCTPDSLLKISFSSDVSDVVRPFGCTDMPDGEFALIPLEMWVTDLAGNQDYCDVTLKLQDNEANFCDPEDGDNLTVRGTLETADSQPVSGAQVTIYYTATNEPAKQVYTDSQGRYIASGLSANNNYNINVYKNDDVRNGVNTLDLVKIQRHILDLEPFTSPYQFIAADINNSESVKPSDLLALRKVILGINSAYPVGQTSWRFLPSDYTFDDENNPWPFAEDMYLTNMQYSSNYMDMVAVKIGDLDNSIDLGLKGEKDTESRSDDNFVLQLDDVSLTKGTTVEIPVFANQEGLYGFQFTMNTSGLGLVNVLPGQLDLTDGNVGVFDQKITAAWHTPSGMDVYTDEALFTLVFEVTEDATSLTEAIEITSAITPAMAFDTDGETMDIVIEMRADDEKFDKFTLFQNRPNPFTSSTSISFFMPTPSDVKINIYDVTGKLIMTKTAFFKEGIQSFDIANEDLGADGILYYEVSAGPHKATMKMVSIR